MKKIGAVTLGQAPRVDVIGDVMEVLGSGAEVLQAGVLDNLTREQISQYAPLPGNTILVSRLSDGTMATIGEERILPLLQKRINYLEEQGVSCIMVFCTGDFPPSITSNIPIIFPRRIIDALAPMLTPRNRTGVFLPVQGQVDQWKEIFKKPNDFAEILAASPYGDIAEVRNAAEAIKTKNVDLIVMDCFGYSNKMKKLVSDISGKPVLLPRTILARVAAELYL